MKDEIIYKELNHLTNLLALSKAEVEAVRISLEIIFEKGYTFGYGTSWEEDLNK